MTLAYARTLRIQWEDILGSISEVNMRDQTRSKKGRERKVTTWRKDKREAKMEQTNTITLIRRSNKGGKEGEKESWYDDW